MQDNENKILAIIDGNAIIHRAYHAIPPMTTKDGTIVNAVYGFASMLLKVLDDLHPDYISVSFDVAGGTFRDDIYSEYKATRVKAGQDLYDQIPLCYQVVEAFNIPIYKQEGFEADDVIGTITNEVESKKLKVKSVVVTGDMDLLQLVDDHTSVYALRKGFSDIVMYDQEGVTKKYGFGPERVVDYKAFRGDSSDNIPGIKGIGEKTAKELIEKVGGVEEIYLAINNQQSTINNHFKSGIIKKLIDGESDARMSYDLATIRRDVKGLKFKLEHCVTHEFDLETVKELFKKFEFFSLLKRIPGNQEEQHTKSNEPKSQKNSVRNKLIVVDKNNFHKVIVDLKKEEVLICKEILTGFDILSSDLVGLVFVTKNESFYFEKPNELVFELFTNSKITLVGHGLKKLVKVFKCSSVQVFGCKLFDIMVASYLLNSSTRAHDLEHIVMREFGKELSAKSNQGTLFGVDPHVVVEELKFVLDIYNKYSRQLKKENNTGLFQEVEMALIPVLAQMELNGVALDSDMLAKLSKQAHIDIATLEKKIWKEAGEKFNVASSTQLRDILFQKIGLSTQGIKKGKTGYSTSASELEKLRELHPVIVMIEDYRELEKLRNTYIDVLPTLVNKKTGRIHSTFNQAVASTGRLSSSDPNMQNIPIRTELGREIRKAFVAGKGNFLVVADYSQIELRIVASLANDKKMIEIFNRGEDIHQATAAVINSVPLNGVTKEMRSAAKGVNFGVLYGMGAFGLSARTDLTQFEAKEFIEKYFQTFSDVKKYLDGILEIAKKDGYVETLFGRRRYVPELLSVNYQVRSAGERMAVNMPIQGTAADIMKMAMIKIYNKIQTQKYNGGVRMILQVHDELVFEVKKEWADEIAKLVKKEMEDVVKLNVPVVADVGVGERWGEIK